MMANPLIVERRSPATGAGDAFQTRAATAVALRPWPYPYRAAFGICSDLDDTPTADDYFDMMRFLNTTAPTRLGLGIGLEVGNSIHFDMPPSQFSYWNADEGSRATVRAMIRSGHVDCLHSFGDLATTRAHAGRALDELARHDCGLKVWVDHAIAPSNFGADIMQGFGDVEGSAVYHADLTHAFGIEYVWRGRVTSAIGQDVPRRLGGIARWRHPAASSVTTAKEVAKGLLARAGSAKYSPHGGNNVVWGSRLRSGHAVREFLRSNPSWAGVSVHETADGFGEVVSSDVLGRLLARGGACVLYTHLGKTRQPGRALSAATRRSLDLLAGLFACGDLLVTTTRRLLDLCWTRRQVSWTAHQAGDGGTRIEISTAALGSLDSRLDGLTFYVANPARTTITVDGGERAVQVNPNDASGRGSVSLPWPRLLFPGG